MKRLISISVAALLLSGGWTMLTAGVVTDEVVRLHIIANSDSEADQSAKLAVRDALTSIAADSLTGAADAGQALEAMSKALPEIEAIAQSALEARGIGYGASASLGVSHFPPREYAGIRLPSGNYNALIVRLGEGEGKNWWCVMYPPLCYAGEQAEGTRQLAQTLETQVEFRFRIAEFIEEIKCFSLSSVAPEVGEQTDS